MIEIGSIRFRLAIQYPLVGGYLIARSSRAMTASWGGNLIEKCPSVSLLLQNVRPYHLQARRTLELIHRRKPGVRVQQSLSGFVVVAAFDRDGLAVREFLAPLFDEYAEDRSLAFRRRKIVARPSFGTEACLECNGDPICA